MKKIISLILVLIFTMSYVSAMAENGEYVYSKWAEEYCIEALELGWIMHDMPKDFTQEITRGQFCSIAYYVLHSVGLDVYFDCMDTPFSDIGMGNSEETYHIEYLYCLNIVDGKSETEFKPDDLITREEAATIILRMCDALGEWNIKDIKNNVTVDMVYADDNEISDWAKSAVYSVTTLHIMQGTIVGFEPKNKITFEEVITAFYRLYKCVNDGQVTYFADNMNNLMPRDENYMFSPLSIKMAFALAANGADVETKEEILNVLGIEDIDKFNRFSKKLIVNYSQFDILKLDIANSIWVNKGKTRNNFKEEFKNIATEFYSAEAGEVTDENAVKIINTWVRERTNGKIDSIIDKPDFWAMIVNAIYFKGAWVDEFHEGSTAPASFTNADGTVSEIDFMRDVGYFSYYDDGSVKIIELPYKNEIITFDEETHEINREYHPELDVSMYILLADEEISVGEAIESAVPKIRSEYVDLYIPKFKVNYSTSLKGMLSKMGLEKAFDISCGFKNILENEPLFVSDVLHKTYISVDEKGTEAAAVTGMMAGGSSRMPEPIEFKADKPFYFVIRDNTNREILFIGRYAYAE